KIKESIGSYMFNALYQQSPSPEEGGIFKRPWFTKIVDTVPPGLNWCRGYDLAVSTRTTADFTASFRVAKDAAGNFYIADGYRGRLEFPDQRRYILERMRSEPSTVHGIEAALHGKALVQDLGREPGVEAIPLKSVEVDKDKMTRALAWAAPAEAGKVFLVRGAWIDAFIEELASFPTGAHDDQIDAVSLAFRLIAELEAELEKEKSKPRYTSGGF
ncbi:MAG: phage terminase large subunit, partial [Pyrinomonadaceae bacterium]|nr:phage terminase large subunit [Pyrinomonadaceae bacterium]